jgi:hypothetical protein
MKLFLTYTLPPTSDNPNPAVLFRHEIDLDPDRAMRDGFAAGFFTASDAAIGLEVYPQEPS